MIIEKLWELGLTDGESKAYISLCELGPSTVGPIVKKSKIAYANIYDVLRRLQEKGLVTHITKGKGKVFSSAPPEELKTLLKEKQDRLNNQTELVDNLIPEIEKLQGKHEPEQAEVFLGFKGLRAAYKKMLKDEKPKQELISIYDHKKAFDKAADEFFIEIDNAYNYLNFRVIADESFKKTSYAKKVTHPIKYTNKAIPSQIDIIGSKLIIISWQTPIMAVLITAKPLADSFKTYFEELWKESKE